MKPLDPDPVADSLEMLDSDQDSVNPDPQHWESVIIYSFTQN
jgi:hypothetical protein